MTDNELDDLCGTLEGSATDEVRHTLAEDAERFSGFSVSRDAKKIVVAAHVANEFVPCSEECRPANRKVVFGGLPLDSSVENLTIELMRRLVRTVPDDRQKVFASIDRPQPQDGIEKKGAPIVQYEEKDLDAETWLRLRGVPVPDRSDVRKVAGRLQMMEVM